MDVYEEQDLQEGKISQGVLDFFLILLRRITDTLELPIVLGPHKLGRMAYAADTAGSLRLDLVSWPLWRDTLAIRLSQAGKLVVPVSLDEKRTKVACAFSSASGSLFGKERPGKRSVSGGSLGGPIFG